MAPARTWSRLAAAVLAGSLSTACIRAGSGLPTTGSTLPSSLSDQLNQTNGLTQTTAQNALFQARTAYGNVIGRLNTLGRMDLEAFQEVRTTVQPPLLIVANALTGGTASASDVAASDAAATASVQEFRQVYSDTLAQMLGGITNNLQVYQSAFEAPQAVSGPFNGFDSTADEAMTNLGRMFSATEVALGFAAELGQFPSLITGAETTQVMDGIRRQQTTIINGVINFAGRGATAPVLRQAYDTIVSGLTSPSLLPQLQRLAIATFGEAKVASRQEQLTTIQPHPNLVVMVVEEAPTQYRIVGLENGKLTNRLQTDSRGLAAADILFQSIVVSTRPSGTP
jgi:hypothetical protein